MTLPLPTVPATVYAALTQVKSADLNDYQTFMAALKVFVEAGEWTRPALADRSPVISTTDRDGRIRSYAGPDGYWMGPAIDRLYEPDETLSIVGNAETYLRCGLDSHTESDADLDVGLGTGDNAAAFELIARVNNASRDCSIHRIMEHNDIDNITIVAEWRMNLDTIGSANETHVWAGFKAGADGDAPGITEPQCGFQKLATETNWQLTAGDGAAETITDSGTPPVADVYQTFRLEYHGANSPLGVDNSTAPVVRYFIDGALEGEESGANVPKTSDGAMRLAVGIEGDSGSNTIEVILQVGPIKYSYNQVIAGDIPA